MILLDNPHELTQLVRLRLPAARLQRQASRRRRVGVDQVAAALATQHETEVFGQSLRVDKRDVLEIPGGQSMEQLA